MKSEERHHLQENDLAHALDGWMRKIEPYSNQILIGLLVVAVLGVGAIVWSRSAGSASEAAWTQFAKAQAADDYLTVADDHPDSDVAMWAKLRAGEEYLNQGLQVATTDKKTMEERLDNAQQEFQQILSNQSAPPMVRERALYGMAVTRESLSGGETQKAIEAYEELVKMYPDSRYARLAEQRIESLKTESAREFYAWFQKQPRNPEQRPEPQDLPRGPMEGSADPFPVDHGAFPQMNLGPDAPATGSDTGRPPSPRAPERPQAESPEADAATPSPQTASPQTPAAEAPAAEPAPATETPAPSATEPPAAETPAAPQPESTPANEPTAEDETP